LFFGGAAAGPRAASRQAAFKLFVLPGAQPILAAVERIGARMTNVIEIRQLRVEYPGRTRAEPPRVAVNGLSLSVRPGEVFGFLGPNGAGKTTTMNVLLGFVNATGGEAFLFGVNVREPIARQRIGYLPELTYYYRFLTAEELLRFYARIFGIPRAETDRRIDALLKLVELEAVRRRPIKTYSKGMQQRVGLAQALINNPDLLILDEPTSGLDPLGRMKVREIIQRLKQEGKTVFFSSHELGEVETVCDRVAIISQGQVREEGRVSDLVSRYRCDLERVFLKVIGYEPQTGN
jgi:ABC-2 type transport system ATP-binding protein